MRYSMELTMNFLFNLSLLIVLLFFCLLWMEKTNNMRIDKVDATIFFIVALIVCNIFSFRMTDGIILDLRIIPFLIGGLYFGGGPILGLMLIIARAFHGIDLGFFIGLFFYGLFTYIIWRISPWFNRLKSRQRHLFLVGITLLVSLVILAGLEILSTSINSFDVWFAYLVVPPLGVAMISYCIESMRSNFLLREHLMKSKKLEAVEQMGAAISHEIRNPLTSASGFVQLLQDDSLDSNTRKEYLNILKEELESAERVIQDYLTFSKPEIEVYEEINVHDELNNVVKLLMPIANQHSVEITTSFSQNAIIEGNRQKFLQCFINIIKNAIEAMPKGGVLQLETDTSPKNVVIRVQDTGMGMTKEQVERLGEPYYTTKGSNGTGLGIMVVFSIVKAMHGTVHVNSEVDKGTVFEFTFKRCPIKEEIQKSPLFVGSR